jgi:carbon-monoxide dehydrogenase medium subunit
VEFDPGEIYAMIPAAFEYFAPASLKEALDLLTTHREDAKVLAGGQSLVPLMKLRLARPRYLVDLSRIAELNYVQANGDFIHIGALATHHEIERSDIVRKDCPLLAQTAATIGDVQVRNRGTIGGSLAHADPAGDLPAAVLALGAEIKAVGPSGERWIKAEEFFFGLMTTALKPDEILIEVKAPVLKGAKTAYLKAAQRAAGFAVAGVAVRLQLGKDGVCEDIAIGLTGVTDKPYRATDAERMIKGNALSAELIDRAAATVTQTIDSIEDVNGSKEYRSHLARIYTARAVLAAAKS